MQAVAEAESGTVHPLLLSRRNLTDDILDDVESVDPSFSSWLSGARNEIHERLIKALTKLLPPEDETNVSETAEAAAKAIHGLDNENEQAIRVLIKAHAAAGNIGAALAIYARLWRHLEDSYDIEPHKLTQELISRLRQEQPAAAAPENPLAGRAASESRPSVVVMPFNALSPALEPQFAIGFAHSVIQALSSLKELFVITRGSPADAPSPGADLRSLGRDLNASYLLHGSIQRSGDEIRIGSELLAVETGEVVRSDRLRGTADDVFDLQDRIAVEVIRSLAPQVRDRELNRAMRKRPDDLDAYQLTLIGYDQMFHTDYTTFTTARANFERAHTLDPTWAAPLSYSAIWHMQRAARGGSANVAKELEIARDLAERALERKTVDALAIAVSGDTV